MKNLLVTGGCGFIGSNFVRYWLAQHPESRVVVYDKLTYAGRKENLHDLWDTANVSLVVGDIGDQYLVRRTCQDESIDLIVNFAAETHVDQSILGPLVFTDTNVRGTHVLLEVARELGIRLHHISTDEVYGHIKDNHQSVETDELAPRSPYAASKAAADQLVQAYAITYGIPVTITRGANNVGPYKYPEKAVPLFSTNAILGEPIPVYGDGLHQVRQVIAVEDVVAQHQRARVPRDELLTDQEGLRQSFRFRLHGVLQADAPLRPVPQQLFEAGGVLGRADDQDVLHAAQHQRGQRVVDHRLVVDGQQLLADRDGRRVQACAGPTRQDDAPAGRGERRHCWPVPARRSAY